MSISGIGNGMLNGMPGDMLAQMRQSGSTEQETEDFAQSLVKRRDSDGDGLLNLGETGLEEDAFNAMDADGDSQLSSDELNAQLKEKMEQMSSMMGQLSVLMQSLGEGKSSEQIASSFIKNNDADADGSLSLDESGINQELVAQVDADGDGSLSAEELGAGVEKLASRLDPRGGQSNENSQEIDETSAESESVESALGSSESSDSSGVSGASGGSGGGGSGDSGDDDEDYDEYDLNKDGIVSAEEYMQAYMNGDMSLEDMFGGQEQGKGQTLTQRLAMQAYDAQASL